MRGLNIDQLRAFAAVIDQKSFSAAAARLGVTQPAAGRMLDVRPVLDDEFVLVAPRDMELPRDITAAALARLALVQYEPGANTRRVVDEWALRAGVALKPIMELGSVEAMKELT